jgi:hypothetical protein
MAGSKRAYIAQNVLIQKPSVTSITTRVVRRVGNMFASSLNGIEIQIADGTVRFSGVLNIHGVSMEVGIWV